MQRDSISQWRWQAVPLATLMAVLTVVPTPGKSQGLSVSDPGTATTSGTSAPQDTGTRSDIAVRSGSGEAATPTAETIRQARAQWLRTQLASRGFTTPEIQDAVVNFVNEQEQATQASRTAGDKLGATVRSSASTDAQIKALLATFLSTVAQAQSLQTAAEQKLDTQIAYTQTPRLEALLRLLGVLGAERAFALNFAVGSSNISSSITSSSDPENNQAPGGPISSASHAGSNANATPGGPQQGGLTTASVPTPKLAQRPFQHLS